MHLWNNSISPTANNTRFVKITLNVNCLTVYHITNNNNLSTGIEMIKLLKKMSIDKVKILQSQY